MVKEIDFQSVQGTMLIPYGDEHMVVRKIRIF
ncbi:hypothetical protein SAMN04488146_10392 [Bacillus nitratireducens]|nr:hypothetical protein SAMN04488146_10392 [Bacillus nitratireducens]